MINVYNEILKYNRIIIHGHMRPDGDCIGSQIGLREILKESFPEKEVYAVGDMSEYVSFLGNLDTIPDELFKEALSIVVDCGNSERISDQRYKMAKYVIKFDHHVPIEQYGDINYVDDSSPACCQMIAELMEQFNLKINVVGATALYTGILTDTGRFKFDSVTGKTLRLAATLLDKGISLEYIDSKLSVETLNQIMLKGYVLSNFKVTEEGFAYILMTRDVIEKYNVSDEMAASQVSSIGNIEGYPIWALFMEYPNEIRIRLRSRGPRIDLLANLYNGGGHQKASGAKLDSWNDLDRFVNDCNNLLKEWR